MDVPWQVNLCDRFGEVMVKNLRSRHCDLMGAEACESLATQENRWDSFGRHSQTRIYLELNISSSPRLLD